MELNYGFIHFFSIMFFFLKRAQNLLYDDLST